MIVLVCQCGKRIRAPGAIPGRVGRCPDCGGRLVVPSEPAPEPPAIKPVKTDGLERGPANRPKTPEFAAVGSNYHLNPTNGSAARGDDADARNPLRAAFLKRTATGPMSEGLLPPLKSPETSAFVSLLYPLRGADCLGLLVGLSVVLWIFVVLVPEYCITMMSDAEGLGASLIGTLFAILAAIPGVILGPVVLVYLLQYLGRVLVSSAMGETLPPRAPDRNAQGLLQGLAPWLVWVVLGVGVGILPVLWFGPRADAPAADRAITIGLLFLFATAYMAPAAMLSFLHDDPLAATPIGVVVAWFKLGVQIPRICLVTTGLIAIAAGPIAVAVALRPHHVWIHLLFALFCTFVVLWLLVVFFRVLGLCYHHRARNLNWHRAHPRWGDAWRL